MKLPTFLKKKTPRLDSIRQNIFRPYYFWSIALIIFVVVVMVGATVGFVLFRSVYFEDYKNENQIKTDVAVEMNIKNLKQAVDKRRNAVETNIPVSRDPSL